MNRLFKWIVGLLSAACIVGLAANALSTFASTSAPEMPDAVAPYFVEAAYPTWRSSVYPPESIPLNYVQQISHVFILPGEDGALAVPGGFVMPQLIERVHAANKKIVVGVGGANSHNQFALMVADPSDRATFVQNLTDFVIKQGYDGVEIDWEFPQTPAHRQNLNALMAELRASLDATGQDLQLNICVSAGEGFGQWIDVGAITPLVDYYLVMTYSFHGGWSTRSGHNAPLYPPPPGVDNSGSVDGGIRYWAETRGVPRSQIVLGLASYTISFDSEDLYQPFTSFGQAYYSDIQPLIGNGYTRHWDSTCQVPYLTQDDGPTLWSYDDPQSIGLKCDYVIENNLAGVVMWDVAGDLINGQQELLETVADKLLSPSPGISLSAEPDIVTIRAGQAATYTLSVTASEGLADPALLTLQGAPSGTTISFDPNPITPPGASQLDITTTASTAAGTYAMTVTGTSGPVTGTTSLTLTINHPTLTLSAEPDVRTVTAGNTATYTLSVTASEGLTNPATLTLQGEPSGATVSFDPNPVTPPGASQLRITTTYSTVAGTYAMTATASSGALTDTANLTLIVASETSSFTLSISPTTRIVKPNQMVSYTATVTGINGFSQPVTLTLVGLPTDIGTAWSVNPVTPDNSSILTLSIPSSPPFGDHSFYVVGASKTQVVPQCIKVIIHYPYKTYLPIILK